MELKPSVAKLRARTKSVLPRRVSPIRADAGSGSCYRLGNTPFDKLTVALAASQAFSAVQAFVTGAIADSDVAAVRAGRRILLEMSHRIADVFHYPRRTGRDRIVAVAVRAGGSHVEHVALFSQWQQLRHGPVHFFFDFLH